jgi:hypothetical protein
MTMKRIAFILLSMSLLWACSKETTVELVKVSDTGCAREEVATRSADRAPEEIILEYSEEGLVITMANFEMNCSVKNGGVACKLSNNGSEIHLEVYEKDGKTLRCNCPVDKVTSVLEGLGLGKEYTLYLICNGSFAPISFTYSKNLKMVVDAGLYRL